MKKILLTSVFSAMVLSVSAETAGSVSGKASLGLGAAFLSSVKANNADKQVFVPGLATKGEYNKTTHAWKAANTAPKWGSGLYDANGENISFDKRAKDFKKRSSFAAKLQLAGEYNFSECFYGLIDMDYSFMNAQIKINDLKDSKFKISGIYSLGIGAGYRLSNCEFFGRVGVAWANSKVKGVSTAKIDPANANAFAGFALTGGDDDKDKKADEYNASIDAANSDYKKKAGVTFGAGFNYALNDSMKVGLEYAATRVKFQQKANHDNNIKAWAHTIVATVAYHF